MAVEKDFVYQGLDTDVVPSRLFFFFFVCIPDRQHAVLSVYLTYTSQGEGSTLRFQNCGCGKMASVTMRKQSKKSENMLWNVSAECFDGLYQKKKVFAFVVFCFAILLSNRLLGSTK